MEFDLDNNRTIAFEGFPYHYYDLSPRQFESLLHDIAQQEIEYNRSEFGKKFDSAGWLDKPGDRGRDILLFKQGKSSGVIQCKHSRSNTKKFTKSECLKEIIKFVLNYLIDNSLIHNLDCFEYYFSVSSNFDEETLLYLSDFKDKIQVEKKLDDLITEVIREFKKIKEKFGGNNEEVRNVLSKFNIIRIDSSLIDNWLNRSYNKNIVEKYFKVKEVPNTINLSDIPTSEIINIFKSSSHALSDYENFFYGINESHIERNETSILYKWINTSLKPDEKPLAVLVGKPGCGKSVVLRDLFDILSSENVPVIGIKADRYYSYNLGELDKTLGLQDSLIKLVETISKSKEKAIILIDQLDALSQTLSAKREYLNTYYLLIHKLLVVDNVRVVISIRKFDLETDGEFAFLKKFKTITLGQLSKEEVLKIINKLNPVPRLNNEIHQLLQIPYNLNAFIKIYSHKLNLNGLNSTTDLYKELWLQKINLKPQRLDIISEKLKSILYEIARHMQRRQMINVPLRSFQEKYAHEMDYLSKEGILKITSSEIEFFHQTFYDFVYAKQFCENNESVLKYVNKRWQSISIRSMVKMVFNFKRETSPNEYLKNLQIFLFKRSVRFHLKLLILQLLAAEQKPTTEEIEFVKRKVIKSRQLSQIFIESISSVSWLKFVINEGIINYLENPPKSRGDKIIEKCNLRYLNLLLSRINYDSYQARKKKGQFLWRYLFRRLLPEGRGLILEYLQQNEIEDKSTFVLDVLYFLKVWDNPKAFQLYDEFKVPITGDMHTSYKILENALVYNVDWVVAHFKESLLARIANYKNDVLRINLNFNHSDKDLLNKLYKESPEKAFKLNFELVLLLVEKTKYPNFFNELVSDHAFAHTEFGDNHDYQYLFTKLAEEIQSFAQKSHTIFENFIKEHFYSKYESINKLIVYGLLGNPLSYVDNIFALFQRYYVEKLLGDNPSWYYFLRKLLGAAYPYFSAIQKEKINRIILSIHYTKEYRIGTDENGHKRVYGFFEHLLFTYLKHIPGIEIEKQKELLKKFQECSRRYKDEPEETPHKVSIYGIGPPLNSSAYEKMSLKQWKISFSKYKDDSQRDFFSHKGGLTEHARVFEAEVKKRPDYFVDFIYILINSVDINETYIVHGLRALYDIKYDFNVFIKIFNKLITNREVDDTNTTYLLWMVDYLLDNEYMDDIVFDFLINASVHGVTPDQVLNPGHLVSDGINSTRGAAVEKLIQISYNPEYSNKIFETVEMACNDKFDCVRAAILSRLAYLNHYDIYRSYRLFKQLVNTDNIELLKTSLWSAKYYRMNFWVEMIPFLKKLMSIDALMDDTTDFIVVSWLEGIEGAEELLNEISEKSNTVRIRIMHVVGVNFSHEDTSVQEKCIQLFKRLLHENSKEIADNFSHIFLDLSTDRFSSLLNVITGYSKAKVCWRNPHYFIEFLFKCSVNYPVEALKLLSNINLAYYYKETDYIYYSDDILNVIVGSYNSLISQNKKSRRQIEHSLNLFDKYLRDQRFRTNAEEILFKNDYT